MPLRDHFHGPLAEFTKWEGFHGGWPMMIVGDLNRKLPQRFRAEPRVRLGKDFEIDVGAVDHGGLATTRRRPSLPVNGTAVAYAPSRPSTRLQFNKPSTDEYEVLVFDDFDGRRLVAAIELVSPGNKDRPEHRRAFVDKCEALLNDGVNVVIVDIVTNRTINLYRALLKRVGKVEPKVAAPLYAVAIRSRIDDGKCDFSAWEHALKIGKPLPRVPLWLSDDMVVPLELELTYEATYKDLRLP